MSEISRKVLSDVFSKLNSEQVRSILGIPSKTSNSDHPAFSFSPERRGFLVKTAKGLLFVAAGAASADLLFPQFTPVSGAPNDAKYVLWDLPTHPSLSNAKSLDNYDRQIVVKEPGGDANRYLLLQTTGNVPQAGFFTKGDPVSAVLVFGIQVDNSNNIVDDWQAFDYQWSSNGIKGISLGSIGLNDDHVTTLRAGSTGLFEASATLKSSGAQVGLPTGIAGISPAKLSLGNHRHAFSGRFGIGPCYIRDASLGGATPAKFARVISNNNWTLRRLSVFALTAPVGTGSDSYGIVDAAGTLQGTAVSLAVGATENATALQVTNLVGVTVYYIAVTARATTPALDVTVVPEYTMNV